MGNDIQWIAPGPSQDDAPYYANISKRALGLSTSLFRALGEPQRVKVGRSESHLVIAPCGPSEGWKLNRNRQICSVKLLDALEDILGRNYGEVEGQVFTAALSTKEAVS